MVKIICDKCDKPAVGFITVGDPTGQRRFDLCPTHLARLVESLGKFFGVDLISLPKDAPDVE